MAESRSVSVIPLNGSNYATWKVQCRMTLIRDGLWRIVSGNETAPVEAVMPSLLLEEIVRWPLLCF